MPDVILVLGMHRNGTSSVAGTLTKLGGGAPRNPLATNSFNERGYFESSVIVPLNDEILGSAGSHWSDWRQFNPDWYKSSIVPEYHRRAKEAFGSEFGESVMPVVKDPRSCRFLPFWLEVYRDLGLTPRVVMPLRSPWDTAKSLNFRDRMPMAQGVLLWLRHVLDAEAETRDLPRSIFTWEAFLADWQGVCGRISTEAGITLPRLSDRSVAEVEQFLSRDLMHHAAGDQALGNLKQLNSWAFEAYEAMKELTHSPQAEAPKRRLTELRETLNATGRIFGPLMIDYELRIEDADRQILAAQQERDGLYHERDALRHERDHAHQERDSMRHERDSAWQERDALHHERHVQMEQHAHQIGELQAELGAVRQHLDEVLVQRDGLSGELAALHQVRQELQDALEALRRDHDDLHRHSADLLGERDRQAQALAEAGRTLEDVRAELASVSETLRMTVAERDHLLHEQTSLRMSHETMREELTAALSATTHQAKQAEERLIDTEAALGDAERRARQPLVARLASAESQQRRLAAKILASGLFDADYYSRHHGGLLQANATEPMDAALHYVREGFRLGCRPNAYFDTRWYLAHNEDVRRSGINPLWHYHTHGWREWRDPSAEFSTRFYCNAYGDIRNADIDPLQHFLRYGRKEGRLAKG